MKGIRVMIVDTRKSADASLLGRFMSVDNPGAGQKWNGWKTKNCLSRDYVEQIVRESPDTLVVAVDGGDVLYGGCDEVTLKARYDQIVSASGGKTVVLGVEFGAWPESYADLKPRYDLMQETRSKVMRAAGLDPEVYAQYSVCASNSCGDHPSYEFANGGFKMGPAQDLLTVFDTLCKMDGDEQSNLHTLLLAGKHSLTLDYTGALVLSLYSFENYADVLSVHSNAVQNKMTDSLQCFVHGNGPSKAAVFRLDQELQAATCSLVEAGHVRKRMTGAPFLFEQTPLGLLDLFEP